MAATPELPLWYPGVQSRVFTGAATIPGDSGAALLDDQGRVVGFSHDVSGMRALVSQSGWIWAEAVFSVHELG